MSVLLLSLLLMMLLYIGIGSGITGAERTDSLCSVCLFDVDLLL